MSQPKIAPLEQPRVFYADLLRVASAFAVILLHVAAYQWYSQKVDTLAWQAFNAYDGLARYCVPIFVMLSGMFFLDPEKRFNSKKMWTKTVPRILAALVVWALVYKFLDAFNVIEKVTNTILGRAPSRIIPTRVFTWSIVADFFKAILSGDAWYHLWFLYMLIIMYVLVPILRVFTQHASRRTLEYFLLAAVVGVGCVSVFNAVAPGGLSIGGAAPILSLNTVFPLMGYIAYFVAGYYFKRYDLSRKATIVLMALGVVGVLVTVLGSSFYALRDKAPSGMFYAEWYINNMFYTCAAFVLAKKVFTRWEPPFWFTEAVTWMSSCTFGVYLVHVLFISLVCDGIGLTPLTFNPIISVPVISLLIFGLSLGFTGLIRKYLPWLARWVL